MVVLSCSLQIPEYLLMPLMPLAVGTKLDSCYGKVLHNAEADSHTESAIIRLILLLG